MPFDQSTKRPGIRFGDPHEFDEFPIASCLKVAELIEHEGYAAGHARREVSACFSENDDDTGCHIFTPVISDAFDHRGSSAISNAESLACLSGGQQHPAG